MKLKDYIVLDNVIPYARASQCYYMLQGLRGEIAIFTSDDPVDSSEILDSGINKKSESSETKSRWQDRTLCVRLLRSDSVEFENYPVEQGSQFFNHMLEEFQPEYSEWKEETDRSKMRKYRLFRPQLLDAGEGNFLIAYSDIDSEFEISARIFNLTQNRDFVRVLGAQTFMCSKNDLLDKNQSSKSFLFLADPYLNALFRQSCENFSRSKEIIIERMIDKFYAQSKHVEVDFEN